MHRKNTGKVVQYALLVLFFVILIGPLLWQLTLAFKGKGDDIYAVPPYVFPRYPTFENFIEAFNRIPVLKYFGNSLIVAAISVCGNVVGSTLAGYALARLKFWGKRIVVLMIFSAMLIPGRDAADLPVHHWEELRPAEYAARCCTAGPVLRDECATHDECFLRHPDWSLRKQPKSTARTCGSGSSTCVCPRSRLR